MGPDDHATHDVVNRSGMLHLKFSRPREDSVEPSQTCQLSELTKRNEEIAGVVVGRMGLIGVAREQAIKQLALPAGLTQYKRGEIVGDVNWTREQEGFQSGGRAWFDMRQSMNDLSKSAGGSRSAISTITVPPHTKNTERVLSLPIITFGSFGSTS
jgi:hypothetical protein